jgi:hypothetical protein
MALTVDNTALEHQRLLRGHVWTRSQEVFRNTKLIIAFLRTCEQLVGFNRPASEAFVMQSDWFGWRLRTSCLALPPSCLHANRGGVVRRHPPKLELQLT